MRERVWGRVESERRGYSEGERQGSQYIRVGLGLVRFGLGLGLR